MGEDDGVGLSMRHVEAAAQRVAELMVQRHANGAKTGGAEPGAVEGGGACGEIGRVVDELGQGG